jgi:hypothetical protein
MKHGVLIFSHCYEQRTDRNNLRAELLLLAHSFRGVNHGGEENIEELSSSHPGTQEVGNRRKRPEQDIAPKDVTFDHLLIVP